MAHLRRNLLNPFGGPNGAGFYHCLSRVVDRNFVFQSHEREVFRKTMRQVEAFSGVKVVTWTILSNHFHVLLHVPPRPTTPPSDEEILDRCRALYSDGGMISVEWEYAQARQQGGTRLEDWRSQFLRRMWDLSEFMKTLKQKFTSWFNRKHQREGTLWERRFKSVLVEGCWNSLLKVAAYIDLNPVRAGIVSDPKDYRWCGYAEAISGDHLAREGICLAMQDIQPDAKWNAVDSSYRKALFGIGDLASGSTPTAELSLEAIARAWNSGGKLSLAQLLRCRIRHFSDGLVLGSTSFVEQFFLARRAMFGSRRSSGARSVVGGPSFDGLSSARKLGPTSISPPPG